jgi:hypothetical protein
MLRHFTTILFLLIPFFYSCKKDEALPTLVFNKTYSKEQIEKVGKLRLFSNTGEISDAATISRFESDASQYLSNYTDFYVQGPLMDSVTFYNNQTAGLVDNYSLRNYGFVQNKNSIILTQPDTTQFAVYGDLYSKSLIHQVGKFKKPIYSETLVSSVGGQYLFSATGKNQFIFSYTNNIVSAPLIGIVHFSVNGASVYLINNEVSSDFSKYIPADDFVAIQSYSVIYK